MPTADLPDDVDALKALLAEERAQNARLIAILKQLQRARFGRSSEKLDPDQLQLALEDIEQEMASEKSSDEKPEAAAQKPKGKRRNNRGALPGHLSRIEEVIEPENTACPCCDGAMHVMGEDVSERLDVIPAQFRVIVTRRPKYACRACEGAPAQAAISGSAPGIVQAPAPARLIEGGLPTEQLVAHVLVGKYADHLPLYRQAQIYSRQGIDLDRSTLADWVGRAAAELRPVHDRLVEHLKASPVLFADETRAPVLDPGRKRTKNGYFWAIARDPRPWGCHDPPGIAYLYAPGRGTEHAKRLLADFHGVLQVDGYAAYKALVGSGAGEGAVALAYCWSHLRRRFYELAKAGHAPIAEEALERIGRLYAIEKEIRGLGPEQRQEVRQARARPIVDDLRSWFEQKLAQLPGRSRLAEAIRYGLKLWPGLVRYLDDGRLEIDTNIVERGMRAIALNRKNALFAGSDGGAEHWGIAASLVETAKLNDVDPHAYLSQTLSRLVQGHPARDIDALMPWAFANS